MNTRKNLNEILDIHDVCLVKYSCNGEKQSLLTTIKNIEPPSGEAPVYLTCGLEPGDAENLATGTEVSLVVKDDQENLYILTKGYVIGKTSDQSELTIYLQHVIFFRRQQKNSVSWVSKVDDFSLLPAA